jgi:transcription elongation factor GreA
MTADLTVGEAVRQYIASISIDKRPTVARELQRFARWYGTERLLREVSPSKLDDYQEQLASQGNDPTSRLEPLRQFLSHARAKRMIDQSLAIHVRLRRRAGGRKGGGRQDDAAEPVEVTQRGFDQLKSELRRLEEDERPQIVAEIARARADGDLRENAPYHAAREHAAEIDRKINEIKHTLKRAVVVRQTTGERAAVGTVVTIRDLEDGEELEYILVGPGEVDRRSGRISVHSPIGGSLLDRTVGEHIQVEAPVGVIRYEILKIAQSS